jgi:hypothetical protein
LLNPDAINVRGGNYENSTAEATMKTLQRTLLILVATLAIGITSLLAQVPVAIRTANAKARKAPNSQAAVIATLHRGETFVVVDDFPYWYKITLKNGQPAYVPKSVCTVVGPDDTEPQPDVPPPPAVTSTDIPSQPSTVDGCTPSKVPANWSVCAQDGSGGKYAQAYIQKNRLDIVCNYAPISPAGMLALEALPNAVRALPDSDPQLQYLKSTESKTVMLEAYLAMAKDGGQEGVNCNSATRLDTHMELVDNDTEDPKNNRKSHMIVEVTPWFHEAISAWSTAALGNYASYVGGYTAAQPKNPPTKIRVYGYLFFDEAHATGATSWRGTAWEIHPVTRIEVLDHGAWKELK